jgi:putative ABC transport system permease protein
MKYNSVLKQSIRAILSNKVRSFLTVLGIIIGIGSVIGLMSLGEGVKGYISGQINTLGSTNLTVTSGGMYSAASNLESGNREIRPVALTNNLTPTDLNEIQKISKSTVADATASVTTSVVVKSGDNEERVNLLGVASNLFEFNNYSLVGGDYLISDSDAVIGSNVAQYLFGTVDVVGRSFDIQGVQFNVSGVLSVQNESSFRDPNNQVYIKDSAAFSMLGSSNYSSIIVRAVSEDMVDSAKAEVENVLLRTHSITDKKTEDFSITSAKDLLSATNNIINMLTSFLTGIAAISLVVGGIGIMNIMLVSVTERTREIGLRKALGAKTSDILIQFLTEALILTLIGGVLGILLGYGIGVVAGILLKFSPSVTLGSIVLAVGISSLIGIVFGIYPALKASKLNPIDALRYE